jgi:hypothetical protein
MSNFIELDLLKDEDPSAKIYNIDSAIKESSIAIILGAPGSGKSSLLKLFENKNSSNTIRRTFQDFDLNPDVDDSTQYLLLDGLDEFRNAQRDNKTGILKKIALKLKQLDKKVKITIACREMDWLGNTDEDALKSYLQNEVQVFTVKPLDEQKRIELLRFFGVNENADSFKTLIIENELFDNPQILKMFVEIYKKDPSICITTKAELFGHYIEFSQEHNEENLANGINQIEPDLFKRNAGYIAYYYMFANIKEFNGEICRKISSVDFGYSINDLTIVIHSKLMQEGTFAHRMIAEYLAAKYLYEEKVNKKLWPISRMKALLTNGENIVFSEYRGVYAWLCFFSKDQNLIEIDPYLQYQYGDNSLFANEEKLKIILAIKKYSESKPYFMKYGDRNKADTLAWENDEKDLIPLYKSCWDKKNHFIRFLNDILLVHSDNPSKELRDFAKEVVCRNELESHFKVSLLEILRNDSEILFQILEDIKQGRIEDVNNELKDEILGWLYPTYILPEEICSYISSYKSCKIFSCRFEFLLRTPNSKLKIVLDGLFPILTSIKEVDLSRIYGSIFEMYFVFLLSEKIEKNFWEEWAFYGKKVNHNYIFGDAKKKVLDQEFSEEKRIELYTEYLKLITPHEESEIESCRDWEMQLSNAAQRIRPQSICNIIEEFLQEEAEFFKSNVIRKITQDYNIYDVGQLKEMKDVLLDWSKRYDLKNAVRSFLSEIDKIVRESRLCNGEDIYLQNAHGEIDKNESYIAGLSDDEKRRNMNILQACAGYYLQHFRNEFDEASLRIKEKTYNEFCNILKDLFKENLDANRICNDITTIKYMAENVPMQSRNIDYIYLAMLILNSDYDYSSITDNDVREYFYIISIMNNRIANIRHSSFEEYYETADLDNSIMLLKRFYEYYINTIIANEKSKNVLLNYVKLDNSGKKTLKKIKRILNFIPRGKSERYKYLVERFLDEYALQLDLDDLKKIVIEDSNLNQKIQNLIAFREKDYSKADKDFILNIYSFLGDNWECFSEDEILFILRSALKVFNEETVIEERNGIIDSEQSLIRSLEFFRGINGKKGLNALHHLLNEDGLSEYWENRIKMQIYELTSELSEKSAIKMSIEKAKEYIFNRTYKDELDFWKDVCDKLDFIKREIEDNRDNQKDAFYQNKINSKNEESCRDLILIKWNDKYSMIAKATKEKYEANNRVDINLQCQMGIPAEVQIECKKDNNAQIKAGIPEQLVGKYLNKKNVNYGIYLVFNFDNNNPENLRKSLVTTIPKGYENKIDVKCLNLRY